jgi:hypothetical protein
MAKRVIFVLAILSLVSLTAPSSISYVVQKGTPVAIKNFVSPEAGCNWSGVGGQVFDLAGVPMAGLVVRIQGTLEGISVMKYAVTGSAVKFGPGGFEINLTNHPVSTQGSLYLQLSDLSGALLSGRIPLTTYNSCDRNLLLVNIVEAQYDFDLFLPLIFDRARN